MSDIQEEQKRLYKRAEENDIKLLKEENKKLKDLCDKYEKPLIFLKNRMQQGMSIEEQNKYSIQYVNNILKGDNK